MDTIEETSVDETGCKHCRHCNVKFDNEGKLGSGTATQKSGAETTPNPAYSSLKLIGRHESRC